MAIRIICKECKTPHLLTSIIEDLTGNKSQNETIKCKKCNRVLIDFKSEKDGTDK